MLDWHWRYFTVRFIKIQGILSRKACFGETKPKWTSRALLVRCLTPVLCFFPAVLSIHMLQVTAVLPPGGLRWKLEWCPRLRAALSLLHQPPHRAPSGKSLSCTEREAPINAAAGEGSSWRARLKCSQRWQQCYRSKQLHVEVIVKLTV